MNNQVIDEELNIRDATANDMVTVADMIQELADYEHMVEGPQLTVEDLQRDGFERQPPAFKCKVAELSPSGTIVGYAIYFPTYSTWKGRALMLEDVYVRENFRRRGYGKKLFYSIAAEAVRMGCCRLDFHVLAWNEARSFYGALGAENLTEREQWCYYRLSGDALFALSIKT
ncbi:thialysine N-epsilon-acetyltransferase-like [Battus philenor]|uniref:thialysine N-epsilon-acetyltransferase-like n=1 Tax=Battus philenor TaxID=42288 RepID=UPI0035D07E44